MSDIAGHPSAAVWIASRRRTRPTVMGRKFGKLVLRNRYSRTRGDIRSALAVQLARVYVPETEKRMVGQYVRETAS